MQNLWISSPQKILQNSATDSRGLAVCKSLVTGRKDTWERPGVKSLLDLQRFTLLLCRYPHTSTGGQEWNEWTLLPPLLLELERCGEEKGRLIWPEAEHGEGGWVKGKVLPPAEGHIYPGVFRSKMHPQE